MSETHDQKSQEDRVTIIVPTFCIIAMEIHRQNMWEKDTD